MEPITETDRVALHRHGYATVRVLGEALFGKVLQCRHSSGRDVAVKIVDASKVEGTTMTTNTHATGREPRRIEENPALEIQILKRVADLGGHKNICAFVEAFRENLTIFVVMELGQLDLFAYVEQRAGLAASHPRIANHLPEAEVRTLFAGISRGLAHLHHLGVAHRDLSLENVLLVKTKGHAGEEVTVPRICDFGLAKVGANACQACTTAVGKRFYFAPEMRYCRRRARNGKARSPSPLYSYNAFASDAWSLGVIMFILLTGFPPFDVPSSKADTTGGYAAIKRGKVEWLLEQWCPERMKSREERVSYQAIDLLKRLLSVDPRRRPSIDEVLRHPFVVGPSAQRRGESALFRPSSTTTFRASSSTSKVNSSPLSEDVASALLALRCSSGATVTPRRPSATTPKASSEEELPSRTMPFVGKCSSSSTTTTTTTFPRSSVHSPPACSATSTRTVKTRHLKRLSGSFIVPL